MKTLIKNIRALVTCDGEDRILHGCDMLLDGPGIAAIGNGLSAEDACVIDGTDLFVYPGLVNTHHHLYQYFTRNLPEVQGFELFDWLTALYEIWKGLDSETIRCSSLAGMAELMKFGCTTCFDHHYVFPKGKDGLIEAQFEAAEALGIRMHASRGSMSLSKKDGGLPPDSVVQDVGTILKDSQRLIETFHDTKKFSMRQIVLAPCSPFSVTADLLRESAILGRQYGVRLHTHLCETKDEERFTIEKTGMRPFAYMKSLGWTGSDVFYAHGIHFNDEELAELAATQTGVAHCPVSNMKLSSGVCRIPEMLKLGIPVGLAVDGSASNDASNLMDEIRVAYLLHRLTRGDAAPTGYDLLKMATAGGAKLLGRTDIGMLKPGMAADLFAIRVTRPEMLCAERDPANLFGTVGWHYPADYVFVNGVMTVKDGRLLTVDEERIRTDGEKAVERLLDRV
ncbi:MAG: 8-oxoguanine deaminase [Clostridia bacterium]|nr:8-oxoguanine deaminase [Clostridia bacterium]